MKNSNLIHVAVVAGIILLAGCSKDKPLTKAAFMASADSAEVFDTVYFTNQSQNANNYVWNFGDNSNNLSVDKNPSHIYTAQGTYKVSLKAIGSNNTDSTSQTITITPLKGSLITEGQGIPEVKLGDTWADVKTVLPPTPTDTVFYSYYITQASPPFYANLVYYPKVGIGVAFSSSDSIIQKTDPAYVVIVFSPYIGTTTKGITLGSTSTQVQSAYGSATIDTSDPNYTDYSYPVLGIDFYTYNQQDQNKIAEMDIYYAQGSSRISIQNSTPLNKFRSLFKPGPESYQKKYF